MHYILGRQKTEPMLPFVRRTKSNEDLVTAFRKPAREIRDMPLAAAKRP